MDGISMQNPYLKWIGVLNLGEMGRIGHRFALIELISAVIVSFFSATHFPQPA